MDKELTERLLKAALWYAAKGWRVFPLAPGDKRPLVADWPHRATVEESVIRGWWRRWPTANVGVVCGASGLFVIDVDIKNGSPGLASWRALVEELGPGLEETVAARTPSGGLHFYFDSAGHRMRNSAGALGCGIDTRADGGYVVAPPSVTPLGVYAWLPDCAPWQRPLAQLPEEFAARLAKKNGQRAGTEPAYAYARIPQGQRNTTLTSLAGALRRRGASQDAIAAALLEENQRRCDPPLPEAEVLTIARSVARYAPATGPAQGEEPATGYAGFHHSDTGNAEAMAAFFGDQLRFAYAPSGLSGEAKGRWLVWAGHHWTQADGGVIDGFAKQTARRLQAIALGVEDHDRRKAMMTWAMASENVHRRAAMCELARSEPPIAARLADFDRDPWLLGCENGVLDLRTGTLRPGKRSDMVSKSVGYCFDPAATCPRWEQFLAEVFDGDTSLIAFLQRAVGYSLTGDISEQCLFLCHGGGSNGKTVLLATLRALLGDYAGDTPFSTFELDHREAATNDLAALAGTRLVTAAETSDARRLNEARIKAITGGDPVTCRFLYSEYFSYTPQFKIWLAMNALPRVSGTDLGIWRRIRLIPFRVTFTPEQADKSLAQKLREELPGILRWAVKGCLEWQAAGDLMAPAAVLNATEAYRQESDVIGRFLADSTFRLAEGTVRASDLYRAYTEWCETAGEKPVSGTAFGRRLAELGFEKQKTRNGLFYYGLALIEPRGGL